MQIRPAGSKLVLITAHRRENFGEPFEEYLPGIAPAGDALSRPR